ncbi:hypothetical protein [Paenibacillus alkalitolerans]|uniref:hypothetical protein n=1 Tax=Paenibacillus alkalitolerans TaxID=2799335 RepID=UPI0018F7ABF2|nr:hypothetical protein [Paenibacillus alkalitolerans]
MSVQSWYDRCSPSREDEWNAVREHVEKEGYGAFRALVEQFKEAIKKAGDQDADAVTAHIEIAERLFPEPAKFSPTWQKVWQELKDTMYWKAYVYRSVSEGERTGEWQILMDNPFTNQEVVCYPGLTFDQAADLFGYFRPTLVNNEYLRLQKVETSITVRGAISRN